MKLLPFILLGALFGCFTEPVMMRSEPIQSASVQKELWDDVVGTAVKTNAGVYYASFGDVCTFGIALDSPYEILARRQRAWPFVLEYKLKAPDGESTLSVSFDTSVTSSDDFLSRSAGFSGVEWKKIRVGPQDIMFREWSDSKLHYCDASARLEVAQSHSPAFPVVIRIAAHSKDRRKTLEDALRSVRLEARSEPFPPNSAMAPYVDLSAQIEVNVWSTQPDTLSWIQDYRAQSRPITVHCVVNSNSWVMDDDFNSKSVRTTHWFTGTNIVEYDLVNATSPWSRVTASSDGNPGRGMNQSDQLTLVARIAWLAFCSGPCLKREGREIFPPSDLWKDLLTVKRFLDETVTFDDSLGLPKVMNLTTGNGQPIFQYRTVSSTNVSGWEFPLEFKVAQYRPVHGFPRVTTETNGWQLEFTATGKVTAVKPTSQPKLPRVTIGTNGWRQLTFPRATK